MGWLGDKESSLREENKKISRRLPHWDIILGTHGEAQGPRQTRENSAEKVERA
jgi:hypothetical protein